MTDTDVAIVGAGPTGLVLALSLSLQGTRVRILDRLEAPLVSSRALAVQARTIELYRPLGLADDVVSAGLRLRVGNMWVGGKRRGQLRIGDAGEGVSPFTGALIYPQDEHERLLIAKLEARGVRVERGKAITALEDAGDHVRASFGAETLTAKYLVGCDGAHSFVRQTIGAEFPGGTYDHVFYVADVAATGPVVNGELHLLLDDAGFLAIFPLAYGDRVRVIGTVRADTAEPTWDDIDHAPLREIGLSVERVNWFSTYRVHHRVADRFRRGRLFIAGDAAHIHSPVGGQGMNTGIGDAVNLAWKLAAVCRDRANEQLLATYEPERIAFARRLVATTDRAFTAASSKSGIAAIMRKYVVPRIFGRLTSTRFAQRRFFRLASQTAIEYRTSALSSGKAGAVHAGDRLPWIEGSDNFAPLTLDWQVHTYGGSMAWLDPWCAEHGIALHRFPATSILDAEHVYLIRPDGYIGAITRGPEELDRYWRAHGLRAVG